MMPGAEPAPASTVLFGAIQTPYRGSRVLGARLLRSPCSQVRVCSAGDGNVGRRFSFPRQVGGRMGGDGLQWESRGGRVWSLCGGGQASDEPRGTRFTILCVSCPAGRTGEWSAPVSRQPGAASPHRGRLADRAVPQRGGPSVGRAPRGNRIFEHDQGSAIGRGRGTTKRRAVSLGRGATALSGKRPLT
jgi:hypothetical protein